jgi:hypothetical protein
MPRCVGRDGYGFSTGDGTVCLHLQLGLIAADPLVEPASVQLMHAMQMHPSLPSHPHPIAPFPFHYSDAQEAIVNVAPKKANWDLRRDIADKLVKLDRRTQAAMIKLMQAEDERRQDAQMNGEAAAE